MCVCVCVSSVPGFRHFRVRADRQQPQSPCSREMSRWSGRRHQRRVAESTPRRGASMAVRGARANNALYSPSGVRPPAPRRAVRTRRVTALRELIGPRGRSGGRAGVRAGGRGGGRAPGVDRGRGGWKSHAKRKKK